ncbi:hypothetical protein FOZ62_001585 [Perkinsus olseni]|uniref:Major facilitator superfamily (MFS) profile domain-containing protein n=2 Tax=Perkinsus olseni TaxID=32597 RepID=A0A7J6NU71_PEROL|nr:hypothetical protein FOZ62_001585 [Perkinsus olseni]
MISTIARSISNPRLFYQVLAFLWTFLVYVMVEATRKSISIFFGVMDVVFMLSYAIGMVVTGVLGDIYNPVLVMLAAVSLAAIDQCTFGILVVFFTTPGVYYLYYVLYACNGVFQSAIWPVLIKIMSNYFGNMHSGVIFGVWATNIAVGNIVGGNLASLMIVVFGQTGRTVISATLMVPAVILVIVGLLTVLTLPRSLNEALCRATDQMRNSEPPSGDAELECGCTEEVQPPVAGEQANRQPIKFWRAWLIPGVLLSALTYACVKGVNDAMFFWTPLYLNEHAHLTPKHADFCDTIYSLGVVVGSLACGWLSDMMAVVPGSGRAPSLFLFQLLALIPVSLLRIDDPTVAYLYVMLFLAGFFIGGAAIVLVSAVCADLGRQDALKGNREAMSQVAGIIDGVGAGGAAIQQGLVSWIATYSWNGVFILLSVALGLSCILIARLAFRESKAYFLGRCRTRVDSTDAAASSEKVYTEDGSAAP